MALIVLLVALCSLFFPVCSIWIKTSYINYLLMVIMFGMGLTIKPQDFVLIFSQPKNILIGCIAQYLIMPALAFLLCHLFHLDSGLAIGVILVGTCPGGTASNVITYLSKGDVAFSICMTGINTLLAPFLTPFITYSMLKTSVEINISTMFFDILKIVLIPIILGVLINKFFSGFSKKITKILPTISVISICIVIACVVSHNTQKIFSTGLIVLSIVILHNFLGYVFGFSVARILKLDVEKTKALSIEIGMQNSGLATGLAASSFPNFQDATVPGAIFSVWHNISGAILAQVYRYWKSLEDNKDITNL